LDLVHDPSALWQAVTIPDKQFQSRPDDDAQAAAIHPYIRGEVFWPAELLRNGVEIEDSAGLNEGESSGEARGADTWDQLKEVDAVLLIWSTRQVVSATDLSYLDKVLAHGLSRSAIFVILNHYDELRKAPAAIPAIRTKAKEILESRHISDDRMFFLSASDAEQSRADHDLRLLADSGLPDFERVLSEFLLNERSATKLLTSMSIAERSLNEALVDVQQREANEPENVVREVREAHARSTAARQRAEMLNNRVTGKVNQSSQYLDTMVAAAIQVLAKKLIETIPNTVAGVEVSTKDVILDGNFTKRRLAHRVIETIGAGIKNWEQETLRVLMRECFDEVRQEIEYVAQDVEQLRNQVHADYERIRRQEGRDDFGTEDLGGKGHPDHSDAQTSSRLTDSLQESAESEFSPAVIVGGAALAGGLAGGFAASIVATALAAAAPIVLPFVLGGALAAAFLGKEWVVDKLKQNMTKTCQRAIRTNLPDLEKQYVEAAHQKFEAQIGEVKSRLDELCVEIREYDEVIGKVHAAKQARAAEIRQSCAHLRKLLQDHAVTLEGLRREIEPLPDHWAASLERLWKSRMPQPSESAGNGSPLDEVRKKVGRNYWPRLEACANYLYAQGLGNLQDLAPNIAFMWSLCEQVTLGSAQEPAYRAVTALAVAEGQTSPPKHLKVAQRWGDAEYRLRIVELYKFITGEDQPLIFQNGEQNGKENFILSYKRALVNIEKMLRRSDADGVDPETNS
jgi:hypothetical protein